MLATQLPFRMKMKDGAYVMSATGQRNRMDANSTRLNARAVGVYRLYRLDRRQAAPSGAANVTATSR